MENLNSYKTGMFKLFFCTILFTSCVAHSIKKGTTMKQEVNKEGCGEMFRPFIEKDFQHWKPWSADCIASGLNDFFTKHSDTVKGSAGSEFMPAYFCYYKAENYSDKIRIWNRDHQFLKLETEYPDINIIINDSFKLPDAGITKLDYSFGGTLVKQGEWVYPEKGVAYFLNGDYNRIIKITIFLPSTIDAYKKQVRASATVREFHD